MVKAVGIDFGTTNSVVASLHEDGSVTTRRHATLDVFRSVLCFWTEPLPGRTLLHHSGRTRERSPPTWKIRWTVG